MGKEKNGMRREWEDMREKESAHVYKKEFSQDCVGKSGSVEREKKRNEKARRGKKNK